MRTPLHPAAWIAGAAGAALVACRSEPMSPGREAWWARVDAAQAGLRCQPSLWQWTLHGADELQPGLVQVEPGVSTAAVIGSLVAALEHPAPEEEPEAPAVRAGLAVALGQLSDDRLQVGLGPERVERAIRELLARVRTAPRVVSLAELARDWRAGAVAIVDARPSALFLGWPAPDEPPPLSERTGHAPGALHVDAGWLGGVGWAGWDGEPERRREAREQGRAALARIGFPQGKRLIVVGEEPLQARLVAMALRELGREAGWLEVPFADWRADPDLPLERCPNYQALVDPGWVHALVRGETPVRAWRVLDVAWDDPSGWQAGHVPGAQFFDTNWVERPPLWNLVPAEELGARLAALGIGPHTTVVVYGQPTMAATRVALALRWWGVEDVRLLDGGLRAWLAAGLPLERGREPLRADGGEPVQPGDSESDLRPGPSERDLRRGQHPLRPELIQSLADAKRLLADPGARLVSVRSWAEQCGETSGYDEIAARGRIPGDTWGHGGSDAEHMQDYEDPDGTLRSPFEVRDRLWAPWGVTAARRVSFYCGTGWRASQAWFVAWLLGWEQAGVFDGGWKEWTLDPQNPIATGPPTPPAAR